MAKSSPGAANREEPAGTEGTFYERELRVGTRMELVPDLQRWRRCSHAALTTPMMSPWQSRIDFHLQRRLLVDVGSPKIFALSHRGDGVIRFLVCAVYVVPNVYLPRRSGTATNPPAKSRISSDSLLLRKASTDRPMDHRRVCAPLSIKSPLEARSRPASCSSTMSYGYCVRAGLTR